MSGMIGVLAIFLGMLYRMAIRAPYTHLKEQFSVLRCSMTYLRLGILLIYFNPDLKETNEIYSTLSNLSTFMFPLYSVLSSIDSSFQKSFWVLMLFNTAYVIFLMIGRYVYHGAIKLKISFYLMEIIAPDMILYLVFNYLEASPFDYYSQSLAFFITMSLLISLCVGGPMIVMNDYAEYKEAKMLYAGLKRARKEWYDIFRHYIVRIEEILIILCHYFNGIWLRNHEITKAIIFTVILFVFMRLQKTYWPYYYRNDNLFMDKAYLTLIAMYIISPSPYLFLIFLLPFIGYLEKRGSKQE